MHTTTRFFLAAMMATLAPEISIAADLETGFAAPPQDSHPETWFHLISGNVSKPGLTTDLEAISGAGISGIQLFHGKGRPWPGVKPQIQCLSPSWDDMISHVADETQRLGLRFTMQNCPGWAMSGGPWITPEKAMRHLIWSRRDVGGGRELTLDLTRPQPSKEGWRDYRDIAVLAFPTPAGDDGGFLVPKSIEGPRADLPWMMLLKGDKETRIRIEPDTVGTWVDFIFDTPTHLRTIELPPVEILMARRNFDPATTIRIKAHDGPRESNTVICTIPRGTWQDRQPEHPLVLAGPEHASTKFTITFENTHPLDLTSMRLSSAARTNDWRGQAGYALRSLERGPLPDTDPAACVASASIVDLSNRMDANGQLTWNAPDGRWTIVRYGHVNTGVKNKPAPPEATGFECDKLSPAGAEQHFAGYIGRLSAPGGPADRGRLQGMLIDSWECYTQTWTSAMEREFAQRRGYALRSWLPALSGWIVDDRLTSERFLRDWRATVSDLLVDHYFGRLAELARDRGMRLSFETAIGDVSPGDILQYHGKADIPMCEFWQPNDPHWGGLEAKPVLPTASAAHIYGKPRIAAEAFTNIGLQWNEHPFMLKHLADRHFSYGINHLVFHTYTHNPLDKVPGTSFGGRIGTPFVRGQTWWRHMPEFTGYLARCQHLLQQGQPVADVLWYLGDDLDHKPRQDSPFPDGYHFDYLNHDVLINRLEVVDGRFRTPEGAEWSALWLPGDHCRRLTPGTLARLRELLQAGGTVIGGPPMENPSLSGGTGADARFGALRAALWGATPAATGDHRVGKGRLVWGDDLGSTLRRLGIEPDIRSIRAATWCHRRTGDTEIYFLAAGRTSSLDANLHFRATGRPEFWDPLTGDIRPVTVFRRQATTTSIPVTLPAAGSVFVVFRAKEPGPSITRVDHDGTTLIDAGNYRHTDDGTRPRVQGLTRSEVVQPPVNTPLPACEVTDEGRQLLAWEDGDFALTHADGTVVTSQVQGTQKISLDGLPWSLTFPPRWDTPKEITLPKLQPWSALGHQAAASFSGTATYACKVNLTAPDNSTRLLLDLGRVAFIAEVTVNGRKLPARWAPPFHFDITPHVQEGSNTIAVAVTNTWHNRLAHEATLKPSQRRTWTINAPAAEAPRQDAGILGPVMLHRGKTVPLHDPASRSPAAD